MFRKLLSLQIRISVQLTKLTPWNRVLLEKLIFILLFKKYSAFYGTLSFITVFTRARHWCYAQPDTPCQDLRTQFIVVLFFHLRLGLPSNLFPAGIPTKILYVFLISPTCVKNPINEKGENSIWKIFCMYGL
jgi:hypothetical protein